MAVVRAPSRPGPRAGGQDRSRPCPAAAAAEGPEPKLVIEGARPLHGSVRAAGCKNAAVALLPAALLVPGVTRFDNVPQISDIQALRELLVSVGATCARGRSGTALLVDTTGARPADLPVALCRKLRASFYLLGALIGRFGEADVPLPGGCDIGSRPVDLHLKGLRALGAEVRVEHGLVRARAAALKGASVYMDVASVGATINTMLAAVTAEGVTAINNAAREPHVVDLAGYLNSCGARIHGAGTNVIKITGVSPKALSGTGHSVVPDSIEAATYLIAGCATGGEVAVEGIIPVHLAAVLAKLKEAGADVSVGAEAAVAGMKDRRPVAAHVTTLPYPGFPTDAQQPFSALLALADGVSVVTETVWDGRFKHASELSRMGARVRVEGRTAIIEGAEGLFAAPVRATDLRAGAALVVAGLAAEGATEISGVHHLDRGYGSLTAKLRSLGATVRRA